MSGNLNVVGSFIDGTFDLATRTWTDGTDTTPRTLGELTLTISEGSENGKVKVGVSPQLTPNRFYLYKTSASQITLPDYNEYISTGWNLWDGYDELAVTASNYLAIVEVSNANLAKAGGTIKNGS